MLVVCPQFYTDTGVRLGFCLPLAYIPGVKESPIRPFVKHRIKYNPKRKRENRVGVNSWSARIRENWRYWTAPRAALLNLWGKANESNVLGIWDVVPYTCCLSPLTDTGILYISLSFHNTNPLHASHNTFLFFFSGFSRKNVLTHGKDFLALGLVVRLGRGKFSSSSQDGTCGYVGSHCSLQRFGLEIPLPVPSQHHKSSTATSC